MLVIWGRNNSVNVQKALWCCEEMAVPYRRIDAGGAFGVVNTPAYRKLNPNGLVPTIDDDGFVLWESNAIVRYLAAKHGAGGLGRRIRGRGPLPTNGWTGRFPRSGRRSARCSWDWSARRKPIATTKAIESSRLKTAEALGIVDAHLESRPFLAGDALTIGDIPLGCSVWRWMALPIERPGTAQRRSAGSTR